MFLEPFVIYSHMYGITETLVFFVVLFSTPFSVLDARSEGTGTGKH